MPEEKQAGFSIVAIYCPDTSFELVKFKIQFEDDRTVEPSLIKKLGDRGMGDGVYYFLEPNVFMPANSKMQMFPTVSESCVGKVFDMQMYTQKVDESESEPKIVKET